MRLSCQMCYVSIEGQWNDCLNQILKKRRKKYLSETLQSTCKCGAAANIWELTEANWHSLLVCCLDVL